MGREITAELLCQTTELECQWGGAFLGRATSRAARWLLGASVTVHLGTAIGWQSHKPDRKYRPRKTAPCDQCDHFWLFWGGGSGHVNTVGQVAWGPKVWVLVLALPGSCLAFGVDLSPLSPLPPFPAPPLPPHSLSLSQIPPKTRLHRISTKTSGSQAMPCLSVYELFPSWRWQLVMGKADVWNCVPAHRYWPAT